MLRNLGAGRLVGLILLGAWSASGSWARAQEKGSLDRGIAPATSQGEGADQPRPRVDRSGLTQPDLRSNGVGNEGEPVDPKIDALLQEWSKHTNQIKKLSGTHVRATRDFAFATESWAEGQFYVETPDKGRIDVQPYSKKIKQGMTVKRTGPNGREVTLTIKPDQMRNRWVCDGKEIKVIDDDHKTYDAVKIPPNQQGQNIVDGPLPFLFGMPPEKAKARYWFKFKFHDSKTGVFSVEVKPKWKQDAIDWSFARLYLDDKTFLPVHVLLTNAAGSTETAYHFKDLQVDRIRFMFWSDPFNPSLTFYRRSVHNTDGPGGPSGVPIAENQMPSVIGMPYQTVKKNLESLGHHVQLVRGDPAKAPEQVFHVEQQEPPARTLLAPQSTITLKLYVRMESTSSSQREGNPSPVSRADYRNDRRNDDGAQLQRTVGKPEDSQGQ